MSQHRLEMAAAPPPPPPAPPRSGAGATWAPAPLPLSNQCSDQLLDSLPLPSTQHPSCHPQHWQLARSTCHWQGLGNKNPAVRPLRRGRGRACPAYPVYPVWRRQEAGVRVRRRIQGCRVDGQGHQPGRDTCPLPGIPPPVGAAVRATPPVVAAIRPKLALEPAATAKPCHKAAVKGACPSAQPDHAPRARFGEGRLDSCPARMRTP